MDPELGGTWDRVVADAAPRDHIVQLYQDQDFLNRAVCRFACVRQTVQDVGVGVDPQAVDKVFEPFYTTKLGGMGIGLSVSRSIIESHHGRLWATPNRGPGATFAFSIPRARPTAMSAP